MGKPIRALVSGAGIAGLTTALWLKRAGFEPVVIERADKPRGGGFLVSLSHYAYKFASALGVLEAMKERDMRISHSSYHNARGEQLLALEYDKLFGGVDVLQIMRDDVVDVLYQSARNDIECRFSDSIKSIIDHRALADGDVGVDVGFFSGLEETFDLLVIAEGQNSPTRSLIMPQSVDIEHLNLCCAAVSVPNGLGIEHKFETHMDLGRYMAVFNTPNGELGAVFVWSSNEREVPDQTDRHERLKRMFEDASPVTRYVIDNCASTGIYMDTLKQVKAHHWSIGGSVLVGDAAHCLTLFSGRGAAAAMTGATRLANQIVDKGVDPGLVSYEQECRRIIDPIQAQTRSAVKWYVPQNNFQRWSRDSAMKYVPNWAFQQYFKTKYSNV